MAPLTSCAKLDSFPVKPAKAKTGAAAAATGVMVTSPKLALAVSHHTASTRQFVEKSTWGTSDSWTCRAAGKGGAGASGGVRCGRYVRGGEDRAGTGRVECVGAT
jgi:hypothetical protein